MKMHSLDCGKPTAIMDSDLRCVPKAADGLFFSKKQEESIWA